MQGKQKTLWYKSIKRETRWEEDWNSELLTAKKVNDAYSGFWGLPKWLSAKNLPASVGDAGSIPGSGRSPRVVKGNPLQYSCRENSTNWQAKVHEVSKSWTQLSNWAHIHTVDSKELEEKWGSLVVTMKDELIENRNRVTVIINSSTKSTRKAPFLML